MRIIIRILRRILRKIYRLFSTKGRANAVQPYVPLMKPASETDAPHEQVAFLERAASYSKPYSVLMLGTIDFSFLKQRPQHIAEYFAAKGYLSFYADAEFNHALPALWRWENGVCVVKSGSQVLRNIYMVTSEEEQKILLEDCNAWITDLVENAFFSKVVIIVQHPMWLPVVCRLRELAKCFVIADYLDDHAGFAHAHTAVEYMTTALLREADTVVASSPCLVERAKQYASKVFLVRNATHPEHFISAQPKQICNKPVVGYFGVMSTWFDVQKIIALDNSEDDFLIYLVGYCTDEVRQKLEACHKVTLVPPVSYEELPSYLAMFSVTLIPFDCSMSLIQATNPVKFYEYLSAGKKVVATNIPELREYNGTLAYLENDTERFVQKVLLCLKEEDTLAPVETRLDFAQKNSWFNRGEAIINIIDSNFL